MSQIPRRKIDKVQWFQNHATLWNDDPTGIGLTAEQVAKLTVLADAAATARTEQEQAKSAARAATLRQDDAIDKLNKFGSQLVKTISAFAQTQTDPAEVYAASETDAPAVHRRNLPAPNTPRIQAFHLRSDGAVEINWTQTDARGSIYVLQRAVRNGEQALGPWETVSMDGNRSYVDATVPAGTVACEYQICALRGTKRSPWSDPAVVRFATHDGNETNLRLAA